MRHCRTEFVGEEFRVKQKVETRNEWMEFFRNVKGGVGLFNELGELVKKG